MNMPPEKKPFDTSPIVHLLKGVAGPKSTVGRSRKGVLTWEVFPREIYHQLAFEILTRYEGFTRIEKAPQIRGIPFDYFGMKSGKPFIIVFRDPVNLITEPGQTLKGRITSLLRCIEGLEAMLIQVSLSKGYYRVMHTHHLAPDEDSWVEVWPPACSLPAVEWIRGVAPLGENKIEPLPPQGSELAPKAHRFEPPPSPPLHGKTLLPGSPPPSERLDLLSNSSACPGRDSLSTST